MKRLPAFLCIAAILFIWSAGCQEEPKRPKFTDDMSDIMANPDRYAKEMTGPVGVVYVRDGAYFMVNPNMKAEAYSILVGLRGTGNRALPSSDRVRKEVRKILFFNNIRSQLDKVMTAPSTAIVRVRCEIPSFAKKGDRLDVTVEGLADARDLNHGNLLPCQLQSFKIKQGAKLMGEVWVEATGYASTTSIITKAGQKIETKNSTKAVITDGATVTRSNPVYLWLKDKSGPLARRIVDQVNELFPPECASPPTREKVIIINVPDIYADNFRRFCRVVYSIKVTPEMPAEFDRRVDALLAKLETGTLEEKEEASCELEACGHSVIGRLKALGEKTTDPDTRKIIAETLSYMGATGAEQHLERFFLSSNKEDRIFAVRCAGRLGGPHSQELLAGAIEDDDLDVCYEAYKALAKMGADEYVRVKRGNNCDFAFVRRKGPPAIIIKNSPRRTIIFLGTPIEMKDDFSVRLARAELGFDRREGGPIRITYVVPTRDPASVEPRIKPEVKTDDIIRRVGKGENARIVRVSYFEDVLMSVDFLRGIPFNDIVALVEIIKNKGIIKPEVRFKE